MWNPFRRQHARSPFPKPKWPPIQSLDSIDVIGKRNDGGVDLVIVASQPIDDSSETLEAVRRKIRNYLLAIGQEEFKAEIGDAPREKTAIIILCEHQIHPEALSLIAKFRDLAAAQGVQLEVRRSMDSPPIPLPMGFATDDMQVSDPSHIFPRVVPRTYFDASGVAHVESERERFGFVRPLGNDLFVLLVYASANLIRNVHQEHLDALGLTVDAANDLAVKNLYRIAFDGTTIRQTVTETKSGNDWSVWIGNDFTSSCILLPNLFAWSKRQLEAGAFLVRVPSTQLMFVVQYKHRDTLNDFEAYIARVVEGSHNLLSSDWFCLDHEGLSPMKPN
jgi:hypothetical protein